MNGVINRKLVIGDEVMDDFGIQPSIKVSLQTNDSMRFVHLYTSLPNCSFMLHKQGISG
jgi:hypothetical protein